MLKNLLAKYNNFVQNASFKTLIKLYLILTLLEAIHCIRHPDLFFRCVYNTFYLPFFLLANPFLFLLALIGIIPSLTWGIDVIFFYLLLLIIVKAPYLCANKNIIYRKKAEKLSYVTKYIFWIYAFFVVAVNIGFIISDSPCSFLGLCYYR